VKLKSVAALASVVKDIPVTEDDPRTKEVAFVLPILMAAVPAPAESRVRFEAAADLMVKAPESAMLLVVNV